MTTKENQQPTNRINIYLIKDKYQSVDDILAGPLPKSAEIKDLGTFFYEPSFQSTPDWIKSFFKNHAAINPNDFRTSGTKAVLIVPIGHKNTKRFFAIPFGSGRHLLKDNVCEDRFGLITALNIIEGEALRGMDKRTLTSNPRLTREQVAKPSFVGDFSLDIERDLIHSISGKSKTLYSDFGGIITGKDSLSVSAKVDISNIQDLLRKALKTFEKKDYKKSFDWVDQIKEIKDAVLLDSLNNKLLKEIIALDENIWLAVPEIIDWTDLKGFKYSPRIKKTLYNDLSLADLVVEFNGEPTLDDLHQNHLCFWSAADDEVKYKWLLYNCLNTEMEFKGEKYLLNSGKWYLINKDFVKGVADEIATLKPAPIKFPDYTHAGEGEYNIDAAKQIKALCMDRNQILYGGGHSSIEFCDILTDTGSMVHAKIYGGSGVLSHLFNQGCVSAELFISDAQFRDAVLKKISGARYKKLVTKNRPDATKYSVVYVVIQKKSPTGSYNLPFFSKVSLRKCKRLLEAYGYTVHLNWVSM